MSVLLKKTPHRDAPDPKTPLRKTDLAAARRVFVTIRGMESISDRIEKVSAHFIGLPYRSNPLVGSAETPEVFTAALDAFDCVTYVETAWAFAFAQTADDFPDQLRSLRYDSGKIAWNKRNHYMTDWVRNNRRAGVAREVALSDKPTVKERTLDALAGFPAERRSFRCYPKRLALRRDSRLRTGDMILFASTRTFLDAFHVGLIVMKGGRPVLRHASRSQGGVVEQALSDFLKKNRMAGVIVVRPTDAPTNRRTNRKKAA